MKRHSIYGGRSLFCWWGMELIQTVSAGREGFWKKVADEVTFIVE